MRNKLEEINLAMVAIKFGEEAANRIADAFTDEDIERTKKQIIVNKRKKASMARWGKKPAVQAPEPVIEAVQAPEPVAKGGN